MDFAGRQSHLAPNQEAWAIPLIKQLACIRAEESVRYHLRPALVTFPTCGVEDKTSIDEELVNITVSGIATMIEPKAQRPFVVTLEHDPPSFDQGGYIVLSIDVGALNYNAR